MQKMLIFICAIIYFNVSVYDSENAIEEELSNHASDLAKNKTNTKEISYRSLQKKIKHFSTDIVNEITNLTRSQINSLIWQTQEALSILKVYQSIAYQKIVSLTKCKMPLAPKNGGLVCAYFDSVYYCKPMCNEGYDFSFLRRSRLYEECREQNDSTWTSPYVGGSKLAECIASDIAVSGVPSAYFKIGKCQQVVFNMETEQKYIDEFIQELEKKDIKNNHEKDLDFVVCGN